MKSANHSCGGFILYFFITLFTLVLTDSNAQTVFTLPTSTFNSSSGTPLNFLTTTTGTADNGAPYTIIIPDGVVFTMDRASFDLTTLTGDVTVQIQGADPGGGQMIFDGPTAKVTINAGDLVMMDPNNTDALVELNSFGHDRIVTATVSYRGSEFPSIIAAGGVDGSGNLLPVEWLSFRAEKQQDEVLLTWATASEKDNDYFAVQHSTDGKYFTTIGEVAGAGTSSVVNEYRFVHEQAAKGTNYYRIRQVDFDGNFSSTNVVAVQMDNHAFQLNSTAYALSLRVEEVLEVPVDVYIADMQGRMLSKSILAAGESHFEIAIPDLPAGTYVLSTQNRGQVTSRLFFKP